MQKPQKNTDNPPRMAVALFLKTNRPHYHLIIFNHSFTDQYEWKTRQQNNGHPLYRSPSLEKLWRSLFKLFSLIF